MQDFFYKHTRYKYIKLRTGISFKFLNYFLLIQFFMILPWINH